MSPQIAISTAVSRDELIDFIRPRAPRNRHHRPGRRAAAGVAGHLRGRREGAIVVATYPERAKTRNARRNPQVSVVVLSDDFGGPWVQVDGTAEVIDVPEAVEPLVGVFPVDLRGAFRLGRVPAGHGAAG